VLNKKTVRPGKKRKEEKTSINISIHHLSALTTKKKLEKNKLFVLEKEVNTTSSVKCSLVCLEKKTVCPGKKR